MKKINIKNVDWIPASHEDSKNPSIWKKVLIKHEDVDPKSKLMSVILAKVPVGRTNNAHIHKTMEEIFYFTEGTGEIKIDGEVAKVKAGDCVVVPAGKTHLIRNTGQIELKLFGVAVALD